MYPQKQTSALSPGLVPTPLLRGAFWTELWSYWQWAKLCVCR